MVRWKEWRQAHPDTEVLDIPALKRQLKGQFNFDYSIGAADRARKGVAFPVWRKSSVMDRNEEIYALEIGGAAKAYPLEALYRRPVVNDAVGESAIVLLSDSESGAVRVFLRAEERFAPGPDSSTVVDGAGRTWQVEEDVLRLSAESESRTLARVPGHVAFWFGWFGFYPETEVWGVSPEARTD